VGARVCLYISYFAFLFSSSSCVFFAYPLTRCNDAIFSLLCEYHFPTIVSSLIPPLLPLPIFLAFYACFFGGCRFLSFLRLAPEFDVTPLSQSLKQVYNFIKLSNSTHQLFVVSLYLYSITYNFVIMGGKPSKKSADQKVSEAIDRQLFEDHKKEHDIIKLLLLGAGESGKSTLFKQMTMLYGTGFTEEVSVYTLT
jgi:G-protein alpha subunit